MEEKHYTTILYGSKVPDKYKKIKVFIKKDEVGRLESIFLKEKKHLIKEIKCKVLTFLQIRK